MGMTIDEVISDLSELIICGVVPFTKGTLSSGDYKVITDECLHEAIETMHKYQKIQKILEKSSYKRGGKSYSYLYDEETRVKHIRKVMENGNDNN